MSSCVLDSIILLKKVLSHIICKQAQFLLMTQIFKVCQIDHHFEHFWSLIHVVDYMQPKLAIATHKLISDL